MMRRLMAVALLAACTVAAADEPSYSFIQASYFDVDLDNSFADVDGNGFSARASVPFNDRWHAFAAYSSGDFDFSVDLDEFAVGGGWHTAISSRTDFFAELAYVRVDASAPGISVDDDGIGIGVGVRSMVRDELELFGRISHVELDDAGGGTSVGGGAWYTVSGNFAVGIRAEFDDDATSYGIGIRLYFDR